MNGASTNNLDPPDPLPAPQARGSSWGSLDPAAIATYTQQGREWAPLSAEDLAPLRMSKVPTAPGAQRQHYFADKRANFPPDIERKPGVDYQFRV